MNHYPDPGITHGPFRVLPVTTGGYCVVDTRRPIGKQTVARYKHLDNARYEAISLDEQR